MPENQRNQSVRFAMSIIINFIMCMIIASWIATQYFASLVGYQPGLGEAVYHFGDGKKVYQPFSWWLWNYQWMNAHGPLQDYITRMQFVLVGGAIISVVIAIFLSYRRSLKGELPEDLHGTARFAEARDVEKMNLISHERTAGSMLWRKTIRYRAMGVYIGAFPIKDCMKVMRYNEAAHVLCFAPTRSGKGVGLVLPTLLSYPHSTATNDFKGENFELSSGFRHTAGSLVIRFDPTALDQKSIDGESRYNVAACWNVLDEIRAFTDYDVMDAQNIAAAIADPDGDGLDDHWVSTSYELLTGIILHVLYYERDKSLTGVATYLADPSFTDPEQMYNRMLEACHDPDEKMAWLDSCGKPTKTHPTVAISARAMLNKEERERNSVLSTAKTKLGLYTEPIVARNISRSDFRIHDLMNHDKPVSLYLVVPPSDKDRLRPLIRMFFTYLLRRLTASMAFEDGSSAKNYRHRLLLLIDELASLKKLEQLQDGLAYIAGYGITAYLFVQDIIQLKEAYGDKETISAGCQLRVAFAPNTVETAETLSAMTGITTRKRQNVSYSGSRISSMLGQMSISEELVERPLLTPDEVMRLPRDEMLVFNAGHPVIRAKKLYYYKMPAFLQRARITSPSRISMTWRDDKGAVCGSWFMVQCERINNSMEFHVTINCYAEFPPVQVLVKQEHLAREEVLVLNYELVDETNKVIDRPLTIDDLRFRIRPVEHVKNFDPLEAYEVHFMVKDPSIYPDLSHAGFFRDLSVHERIARKTVKDHFHKLEAKNGEAIQLTIDKVDPNSQHTGTVLMQTAHYIVLQKGKDRVSLHRKLKLTSVPSIHTQVTIRYEGKKGQVH